MEHHKLCPGGRGLYMGPECEGCEAIRQAVAEEREACAHIADEAVIFDHHKGSIAPSIRARGNQA